MNRAKKGFLDFFSGRRAIQKTFKTEKLSKENQAKKKLLEKKPNKTPAEEQTLSYLQTVPKVKVAPLEPELRQAYRQRSKTQRWFNQFYPKKKGNSSELFPSQVYLPMAYGIYQHPANTRRPVSLETMKIPNADFPNAPELPQEGMSTAYIKNDPARIPYIIESQADVEIRVIPKLFALWVQKKKGTVSPYTTIREIPDELYEEFVKDLNSMDLATEEDELAMKFFGRTVDELNAFIKVEEIGPEDQRVETKEITGKRRNFFTKLVVKNGQTYVSTPGGVFFNRYVTRIKKGKQDNLYFIEFNAARCAAPLPGEDDDFIFTPLTTLKSNGCITILSGTQNMLNFVKDEVDTALLFKNWVVIEQKYLPFKNPFERVYASKFLQLSFIQDAIDDWGLVGMDPLFYELLKAKYPDVLFKVSATMVSHKEFPKVEQSLLRDNQNFILLDSAIYTGKKDLTIQNPFVKTEGNELAEIFQRTVELHYLYGMTPYMAYLLKKLNPAMWIRMASGGSIRPQQDPLLEAFAVYKTLSPLEKITVDYLQYLSFMDVLRESVDSYNYVAARNTYKDALGDSSKINELISLYNDEGDKHRRELKYLQQAVLRESVDLLGPAQSEEYIRSVLSKFPPSPLLVLQAPPQKPTLTRKVFAPTKPRNTGSNERNVLLRDPNLVNTTTGTRKNKNAIKRYYDTRVKIEKNYRRQLALLKKREEVLKKLQRLEELK